MEAVAQISVRGAQDDFGVSQNFLGCDREQELLLPPSLREWLPEGHLAGFVIDAVAQLDLAGSTPPTERTGTGGRRTIRR